MEVKQKIWTPMEGNATVLTIASDIEHVGNLVAEGMIHKSMFWPEVARIKEARLSQVIRMSVIERARREADIYRRGWVSRWLEDTK